MSATAKTVFGICCLTSCSIIGYVHYKQNYDREQLHMSVLRDIERQERRKTENLYNLEQQQELHKFYKLQQAAEENFEKN